MPGIFDALKIIREQFPKFTQEMGVPFLGKDKPSSVMDKENSNSEKHALEAILEAAVTMLPGAGIVGKAAIRNPKLAGAGIAAATQDPTALINNPVLALAASSGDANAAIRPGGISNINMTHESDVGRLLQILTGRGSLSSPSVAISKNTGSPFSQGHSATLLINPESHLFDPRTAQANQLFNRDAYVTRWKGVPNRDARLSGEDLRLTEGSIPTEQQALSIMGSPRFKSFAEYEKSDLGAKLLIDPNTLELPPNTISYNAANKALRDVARYDPALESKLAQFSRTGDRDEIQKVVDHLNGRKDLGIDKVNINELLARTPSGYGELKVLGEIPITDKNIKAALLPGYLDKGGRDALIDMFDARGIPSGDNANTILMRAGSNAAKSQMWLKENAVLDDIMPILTAGETFNKPVADQVTKRTKDALGFRLIDNLDLNKHNMTYDELELAVLNGFWKSDSTVADVFSLITSQ